MTQFILIKMEIGEIGQPGVAARRHAGKDIMLEVGNVTIQRLQTVVCLVKVMERNKGIVTKDLVQLVRMII